MLRFKVRRAAVKALEMLCDRTHWVTHHRPFLWLPVRVCQLAYWSDDLDQRWGTNVWKPRDSSDDQEG